METATITDSQPDLLGSGYLDRPLKEWTQEEVGRWFESSPDYKAFANAFNQCTGSVVASATETMLAVICGPILGGSLYNTLQKLNQGTFILLSSSIMIIHCPNPFLYSSLFFCVLVRLYSFFQ